MQERRTDPIITAGLVILHMGAIGALFCFSWSRLALAVGLYALTMLGITVGYHRLLTHRSFKAPKWLEYLLTLLGAMSCQGGPISWVTVHRVHHAHSDREGDPHGAHEGFWWSHVQWLASLSPHQFDDTIQKRVAPDLLADPVHRFLDRNWFMLVVILGSILLHVGGWSWVLWGIFLRILMTQHAIWLVNSGAHKWGYQTWRTGDLSTNCWWVALLTFGEGWHNNHHAFPASARHGLKWYEIDVSYLVIRGLERLGLAWDLKTPTEEQMAKRA